MLAAATLLVAVDSAEADGVPDLLASDTAAVGDPIPFWRKIDCQSESRQTVVDSGGDPAPTATGAPQGDDSFRHLTVFDGDDYFGERCELGWNDRKSPVAFYRERRRRITYASFFLPPTFPLATIHWQGVLQMKQAAPADNSGGPPVLSLSAYNGRWMLWHSPPGGTMKENLLWSAPARAGVWTRFAFDVRYSRHKRKGRITVYADLTGDGAFDDPGERSRRIHTNTLKREIAGTGRDRIRRGQSIPSHLRVGIYHDEVIPCPSPVGCSVDVDNIQIVAP